jgi:hypothetical protein
MTPDEELEGDDARAPKPDELRPAVDEAAAG